VAGNERSYDRLLAELVGDGAAEVRNPSGAALSRVSWCLRSVGLATSAQRQQGEVFGAMTARTVKERLGDKEFDMKTLASVASGFFQICGYTYELEEMPTSIKVKSFQCPFYEGLKNAGLDDQTIEAACNQSVAVELAELKKAFPQLSGRLKFRSAPDQPCIEEFELAK
jgi:hypothetical protein